MSASPEYLLAIETSGQSLGVALLRDGVSVFEQNVVEGLVHGRALAPLMERALQLVKDRKHLVLAVSVGPGSWTGLRIGVSAAKTFAWAAAIPIIPIPTFEALVLAAAYPRSLPLVPRPSSILTLRDARSEGFFAALFDVTGERPRRLLEESVIPVDSVTGMAERILSTTANNTLLLCGDAKCMELMRPSAVAKNWVISDAAHVSAWAVAELGLARWRAQEGVLRDAAAIHKLAPLYLRASDPELKFNVTAKAVEPRA